MFFAIFLVAKARCCAQAALRSVRRIYSFTQPSEEEQTTIFLRQLQLQQDSSVYQENTKFAQKIIEGLAGLPLALSMAAGYPIRDRRGWKCLSNRKRKEITVEGKQMFRISQHTGLASVFKMSIQSFELEVEPPKHCSSSWAELYISLSVMDPASQGSPLGVLSLMWRMCAEFAQEVFQTFVSLSLATLSVGDKEKRMLKLHDLQLQYCSEQCARARTPSHYTTIFLVPECVWHFRIIEGLLAKAAVPMVFDRSTESDLMDEDRQIHPTGFPLACKPGPRHLMPWWTN
jgi:hypothetical protein